MLGLLGPDGAGKTTSVRILTTLLKPDAGRTVIVRLLDDAGVGVEYVAVRHLRAVPRDPELLIFATIQPLMFVLLFTYVFGGSIAVPGFANYTQFDLSVSSAEAANLAGFIWMFPRTFVSSAFVDPSTTPSW